MTDLKTIWQELAGQPTLKTIFLTHDHCTEAIVNAGFKLFNPAGITVCGITTKTPTPTKTNTKWHKYWIRNAQSTREGLVLSAHFLGVFIRAQHSAEELAKKEAIRERLNTWRAEQANTTPEGCDPTHPACLGRKLYADTGLPCHACRTEQDNK